jgi:hypothetical protein
MNETLERESVTKKTFDLVEAFERSLKRVEQLRREITSAECQLSNDQTALAKWLIPKNAKVGEQFNVWYGNRIICVVVDGSARDGRVSIRQARND